VRPFFERYIASFGLSDRLKFYAGDFFSDPLPEAEVLSMGHILHDWNREVPQSHVSGMDPVHLRPLSWA
jgi:hypothetical protein